MNQILNKITELYKELNEINKLKIDNEFNKLYSKINNIHIKQIEKQEKQNNIEKIKQQKLKEKQEKIKKLEEEKIIKSFTYDCVICDKFCMNKKNYETHCGTDNHKNNIRENEKLKKEKEEYEEYHKKILEERNKKRKDAINYFNFNKHKLKTIDRYYDSNTKTTYYDYEDCKDIKDIEIIQHYIIMNKEVGNYEETIQYIMRNI